MCGYTGGWTAPEALLEAGHCDWGWLCDPQRLAHAVPDRFLRVHKGHAGGVKSACVFFYGRLLPLSKAAMVSVWDGQTCQPLGTPTAKSDRPGLGPSLLLMRNETMSPGATVRQRPV
jgi:hypothetical protein